MVKKAVKKDSKNIQPEVNIGLIGHVDHGKTTLTERLSGKWADTHSEEIKRGITIRLGYADTAFRKCKKCDFFTVKPKCPHCTKDTEEVRKISFVDAPGHESLMATMLAGATIMDGALLLVAANEECPQPQTREHLMALEIMGVKNVIIVQNKVDLTKEDQAMKNYKQIKDFLAKTSYKDSPIIPISAQYNVNIDLLIRTIEKVIPTPKRNLKEKPKMFVARSFDINKPGSKPEKLIGGVLGGALAKGQLIDGDEIEIRPGRELERDGRKSYIPIITKIVGLKSGGASVDKLGPGGSIGVLTSLDPGIVKSDKLSGSVVGHVGTLPPVWTELKLETHLLKRVVGSKEDLDVESIKLREPLMLNVNSAATVGVVTNLSKDEFDCILKLPVCAEVGARVTISRRFGARFRLIGFGLIK
ncbi:translation initiation factor IF-2 subunit gamma [Candidatus Woesearchaeota archaeon]|jgi:translation initiation factor 2 subunit 3|nr:translation initiation factor IF-2 subunit gamma [Candidatus Woesearchaeota archaeon]